MVRSLVQPLIVHIRRALPVQPQIAHIKRAPPSAGFSFSFRCSSTGQTQTTGQLGRGTIQALQVFLNKHPKDTFVPGPRVKGKEGEPLREDGWLGPDTIKALQSYLNNCPVEVGLAEKPLALSGVLRNGGRTTFALQSFLNHHWEQIKWRELPMAVDGRLGEGTITGLQNFLQVKHAPREATEPSSTNRVKLGDEEAAEQRIEQVLSALKIRDPNQDEFHQAAEEVLRSLTPLLAVEPKYSDHLLLERIVEPERQFLFRVPWVDDEGRVHVNRGFRVQFNSAIGPYKGGLRFHYSVNLSILKFLGFEQIFKNSLTSLPIGGGKGGSDFDPKGKSNMEVMRFCQSFMTELERHIGENTDVPAGDIGVGAREIGYMYGQYKRLRNEATGVLTGKDLAYGGSLIRPEATGYGVGYFVREVLKAQGKTLKGLRVGISGAGNVALHACEKVLDLGGIPVTLSDETGFIYDPDGVDREKLAFVKHLVFVKRGDIDAYVERFPSASFQPASAALGHNPLWSTDVDVALPCATQNELNGADANHLIENNCIAVVEGANMPCTPEAVSALQAAGVLFGPGKAANAGGVATSALEMSQNSQRLSWTREEVDAKLDSIMTNIHAQALAASRRYGQQDGDALPDYVLGANIAGFMKVADAMLAQGIV